MSAALSIIAIAGLLVLIIASLRVQYAGRAQERQEADARARVGETQHQDSLLRRSQVRAAGEVDPTAPRTDE
jgi:hypothetical protein